MKTLSASRPDRLFRAAAWFYLVPRLFKVGLVLGAVALAVFMVATQLLLGILTPK